MGDSSPTVVYSRRHFIRTVIAGSAMGGLAAACEAPRARAADASEAADAGPPPPPYGRMLAGEVFDRCHAVRDGKIMPMPSPGETVELVVIGGGPSGLFAAHRLNDRDVVVLEKEPETGGNCRYDEWQGVRMSTGGAFYTASETSLVELLAEIGAPGMPVEGPDALVIHGQPTKDFFRDGAKQLPFPVPVQDDFRRSRDDLLKLYKTKKAEELDVVSFAELLKPYAPEVRQFWDSFGQSNWGGTAENTSGYVGAEAYTWAGAADDPRFTYPGGMSGAAVKLSEVVRKQLGSRLRTNTAAYSVDVEGSGKKSTAVVRYFDGDVPKAIRAKAVIVAAPKYFAKYLVHGIAPPQLADMKAFRYLPFCVFNVCLSAQGPEPAYDNFFLDAPFTDYIPADWVIHAGKGPKERRTALTVYHPLPEAARATLLADNSVADLADGVATHLERHFPGTIDKIVEIRVFRRGHGMYMSTPGRMAVAKRASAARAPVFFANTDCGLFSTFYDAVEAGARATFEARRYLGLSAKAPRQRVGAPRP